MVRKRDREDRPANRGHYYATDASKSERNLAGKLGHALMADGYSVKFTLGVLQRCDVQASSSSMYW
jgi:hypothetical protein